MYIYIYINIYKYVYIVWLTSALSKERLRPQGEPETAERFTLKVSCAPTGEPNDLVINLFFADTPAKIGSLFWASAPLYNI